MTSKKLIALVTFVLLAFTALPAAANSGRVMTMSGDVKVNGQTMRKSHVVQTGDKITTGANSHVNIVMSDRSVLDIRPNTKFQLEKFSFNKKKPKQGNSLMNLLRGSFRYISGLIGRTNHKNSSIRLGTATAGIRGSFATFFFDGQKAVIDVSLGKIVAVLANGQTITIEKKKGGETDKEKSSSLVVDQGEKGTIVFSTEEGEVIENPSPDAAMEAAEAILKDPSPEAVKAAMEGMSDAEKAMVVAVITANATQLNASVEQLTAAVTAVVQTDPTTAPLVAAIATAVASDGDTASSLVNAVKSVEGVDDKAVDAAVKVDGEDGGSTTGGGKGNGTDGGTDSSSTSSGGGGDSSN